MSRCFPFPPPGYEKKARTNDVDLLKKEKQKEKKHKKEKKDKEKRQGKEKKENDRSDGKNRDKKDRKEKDRDKKKEKDRNKDKDRDRSNLTDEKKLSGHTEGQSREKTSDEKKLQEKSEGHNGGEFSQKEKERNKYRNSVSGENKLAGRFSGYNGEKLSQNSHLAQDYKNSKFVQDLGRKVRDEERGTETQLVEKFMGTEQKREEGSVRLLSSKSARMLAEGKEKNKKSDNRRLDGQGIGQESRFAENALVHNVSEAVPTGVDGIPRQVDRDVDWWMEVDGDVNWWMEGKEKTKEKEIDDRLGDKQKDKDGEKKSHVKDKDKDKEKKEEKAKAKGEQRNVEQGNLNKSKKVGPIDTVNLKASHPSKESNKNAVVEENLRKRKEFENNGFVHANDMKSNKLLKSTSSHPLKDNGTILQSCQVSLTPDGQGAATNIKVDSKERKVNGVIEAQMISVSSTKSLLAGAQLVQADKVSTKPPHPDSKFLSQVLSVPKMEEWPDFDAQEWLFENNGSQSKKPNMGTSEIDKTPQVWADSLWIESADVHALPYVLPY
ncbi:hypothetical protein SLEP1_g37678 [Rubroshorea leprosula]|uniref:Uncharacterized protein n=1 Tax=Rubroshorea leprosula TaxID=152421 RepID=A0AAV5KVG6_9ROSI|nr:hypothetical protein SLEP1_g37678 [Rubroshorea leprosula]